MGQARYAPRPPFPAPTNSSSSVNSASAPSTTSRRGADTARTPADSPAAPWGQEAWGNRAAKEGGGRQAETGGKAKAEGGSGKRLQWTPAGGWVVVAPGCYLPPPHVHPPPRDDVPPHPGGNRCQVTVPLPPPGGTDTIANEQITAAYYAEFMTDQLLAVRRPRL